MAKGTWLGLLLALVGGAWALSPVSANPLVQAKVAQGRLDGSREGGLLVFKGIPYAAPPTGALRWRPPGTPIHWRGTRNATSFGPSCIQPPYPAQSVYFEPARKMSEDCLTLNIWAPEHAHDMPVIVWIHGGALTFGTSADPMYDGAVFARRGVIFVSINYRLGVFGWLAHPALSAESPRHVSGNYGLLDQIAALKWVKRNIAAFGGDPGKVTVMGESAGALSISYLLTSPEARGLFERAIMESTNIRAVPRLHDTAYGMVSAEATGQSVADAAGAKTLADLRSLSPLALVMAAIKARFISQGTIDGAVLPDQVVAIFDRGEQAKVPILAGFNSGEVRSQRGLVPSVPASAEEYEKQIRLRYGDLAPEFLRLYPASDMANSLIYATRDAIYGWATEKMVRQQSAAGLPSYMYLFDYCYPAARARDLCGFHASELPFVFDRVTHPASLPPNWPMPDPASGSGLAKQMIGYWVSFIRNGVPRVKDAPVWQPYGHSQAYLHIADPIKASRDPISGMFEMQDQLVARRRAKGIQWFNNIGPDAPLP